MSSLNIKAVVFDMGGVLIDSPLKQWNAFERRHSLTEGSVLRAFISSPLMPALERGQCKPSAFLRDIKAAVDDMLPILRLKGQPPREHMMRAVEAIQMSGIRTALLTNNWFVEDGEQTSVIGVPLHSFDVVVESCRSGLRKPDKEIYEHVLKKLGVRAEETAFLDDLGHNLKTARRVGMHTIKVEGDGHEALRQLQLLIPVHIQRVGDVGTLPVRAGLHLDMSSLLHYIRRQVPLILMTDRPSVVLRQFAHGQSNPTYYLKIDGHELVLRKKPPGKLLRSAHAIEREFKVMSIVGEQGVPVPRMIHLCHDSEVIGTPFYLMSYVRGRVFTDVTLSELDPRQRRHVYTQVMRTLALIHRVDIDVPGLHDYGRKGGYLKRNFERWRKQYELSSTGHNASFDNLVDVLRREMPTEERCTLVHGDYRLDNVIFDDALNVVAVLDWEISTLGEPMTDLATTLFAHYTKGNGVLPGFGDVDPQSLGIPSANELMEEYCSVLGQPPLRQSELSFYVAFVAFRFAAIIQGVYKRALHGQASSGDKAKTLGDKVESIAAVGLKLLTNNIERSNNSVGMLTVHPSALSPRARKYYEGVKTIIEEDLKPLENELREHHRSETKWVPHPLLDPIKRKARDAGLVNMFISPSIDPAREFGCGLTNVEYAHMCELMGKYDHAPDLFNCQAPDTGNMEVLIKYGSARQKETWLRPLLEQRIRSCFAMSEPAVASSDASNISTSIVREGDQYVINGRKWYISGAGDPRCAISIVMGRSSPSAPRHQQHSLVLVPMDTPGVTVNRPMAVFGSLDAPSGHCEITFDNVRVPAWHLIGGEGRGFEMAQGRLGPGRIHHCMRLIGSCERAIELMLTRMSKRVAFGKPLAEHDLARQQLALSRVEVDQARLLVLNTAHIIDQVGSKQARMEIAMIKVLVPSMACRVIDRAIQMHGAAGVSQDTPLASMYAYARSIRIADGPDEVHTVALAKAMIRANL